MRHALRARELLIFMRSDTVDNEIIFIFGTSFSNLLNVSASKSVMWFACSRTFPFDHFFFLFLDAEAAMAFWAFVFCWTFGGMFDEKEEFD